MEEQFVVRVPERIRAAVGEEVRKDSPSKMSIKMLSSREGLLTYEGKTYSGWLVDLPCIVESHKTVDNRQFVKVCDISKIFIFSEEALKREDPLSGITPPMKCVRARRFRKRLTKAPIVEEIEKAVARLLERDREAVRVDVQLSNRESDSEMEDVSSLAAEIELNLMSAKTSQNTEQPEEREEEEKDMLKAILLKIEEKKRQLTEVTNAIVKKRFEEAVRQLEEQRERIEDEIKRRRESRGG
jgi:transcription initiation factor TFIID subunit 7